MIKRFLGWFVAFGISYLIQALGWADQGTAFVWLHFGFRALFVVFMILFGGWIISQVTHPVIAFPAVLIMLGEAAVPLLATWAATAIFNIEFGIAYQIMTFGQCLIANDSDKD
ncbi:MAG: hypothetical protein IKK43_04895 [Clostridia bacterium]|nr:hypothetical protein [Clostridia bacterium]